MDDYPGRATGGGWWEASDHKWYPPELHPDYRPPLPVPEPEPDADERTIPPTTGPPPDVATNEPSTSESGSAPSRHKRPWAGVVLLVLIVGGVALMLYNRYEDEASDDLRPAAEVRLDELQEAAIGEPIQIGEVTVTVQSVEKHPDWRPYQDWTPALAVSVRAENPSDVAQSNPVLAMLCAGDDEEGEWFIGSTYEPTTPLPAGSFDEGVVDLGVPHDGEQVASCPDPMIVVKPGGFFVIEDDGVTGAVVTEGLPQFGG